MLQKQIDSALGRYYELKGRYKYYYDDDSEGKFSKWCKLNRIDDETITNELQKEPSQCNLILFDIEGFPNKTYHDKRTMEIYTVIQQCWNNPDSYILDIVLNEKKDPVQYICSMISKQQQLWFDGYCRREIVIKYNMDNLYIPMDIINIIRLFFMIDIKSLYNENEKDSKHSKTSTKWKQKFFKLGKKLSSKNEHFIAYKIISILLSGCLNNDDRMNSKLYYGRAVVLRRWNELIDAENDIKFAIKCDKFNTSKILFEFGKILYHQSKFDMSLEQLLKAIDINGKDVAYHMAVAKVYEAMNNFDNATITYLKVIEMKPNMADYRYDVAKYLQKKTKEYEKAEIHYQKAIELDPNNYKYRYEYGRMLAKHCKKYDLAIKQLKGAILIDSTDSKCIFEVGKFYEKLKDYDNAKIFYLKAIVLAPNNSKYHFYYADLCKIINDFERYKLYLKAAIDLDPINHEYCYKYAKILRKDKEYKAADTYYSKAILLNPKCGKYHRIYGDFLHKEMNDYEAAKMHLQTAIDSEPGNAKYYYEYGKFLRDYLCDYRESEIYYKKCLEIDNDRHGTNGSYGYLLYLMGEYEKANNYLEKELKINGNNGWANYYFSILNKILGNEEKANISMEKACTLFTPEMLSHLYRIKEADPQNIEYHEKFEQMWKQKNKLK